MTGDLRHGCSDSAHSRRSVLNGLAISLQSGHHERVRGRLAVTILVLIAGACASGNTGPSDPQSVLQRAARRSLAEPSAMIRGKLGRESSDVVSMSGAVDFRNRRTSVEHMSMTGLADPPFEVRFVQDWNYVEIDPQVQRPPTLNAGARWVAYKGRPGTVPVPDRALPPSTPIEIIEWARDKRIAESRLTEEPDGSTRIAVTFADSPEQQGTTFTYTIDRAGRISAITTLGQNRQTVSLSYVYGNPEIEITEPVDGVQRLGVDETLYPTATTRP